MTTDEPSTPLENWNITNFFALTYVFLLCAITRPFLPQMEKKPLP